VRACRAVYWPCAMSRCNPEMVGGNSVMFYSPEQSANAFAKSRCASTIAFDDLGDGSRARWAAPARRASCLQRPITSASVALFLRVASARTTCNRQQDGSFADKDPSSDAVDS
jgi:hypothetical protein